MRTFVYVRSVKVFFFFAPLWPLGLITVRQFPKKCGNVTIRRTRKPVLPWLQPWHCCQQSRVPRLLSLYIPPRTVLHQRLIRRLNLNQRMEKMLLLYVTWTKCSKIEKRKKKTIWLIIRDVKDLKDKQIQVMWPVKAQITSSSYFRIRSTKSEFQESESFHFLVAYDIVKTTLLESWTEAEDYTVH